MAADQTLVQGAYLANKPVDQGKIKAQQDIGKDIASAVGKLGKDEVVSKKEDLADKQKTLQDFIAEEENAKNQLENDFSTAANKFLNNPNLSESNYDATYDIVFAWKDEYINGTDKDRAKIMNRLNNLSGDVAVFKEGIKDIANIQKQNGFSRGTSSENTQWYTDLMQGNITMIPGEGVGEDGQPVTEMGITGPDGNWMSMSAFEESYNSNVIDSASINNFYDMMNANKKLAEDDEEFDPQKNKNFVRAMIRDSKNLNSLIYDEILETGRSFATDIKEHPDLVRLTYKDLGLDNWQDKFDKNNDGIIDEGELGEEDRNSLIDNYLNSNDPATVKARNATLENYFYKILEQSHGSKSGSTNMPAPELLKKYSTRVIE